MRRLRSPWFIGGTAIVAVGAVVGSVSIAALIIAVLAGTVILKAGFAMLGGMAQPLPEPPPPGELRRVKIQYRCSICGSEARMTVANDEMPDPPKHCLEEMDLVTPVE